jgi:hypothetical protein
MQPTRSSSSLFATLFILAAFVSLAPASAQNRFLRNVVEEFALRAKQDARVGEQVSVPDSIFRELAATADKSAPTCGETHRHALAMFRILPAPKGEQAFAILGRGLCYCKLEGNCRFWIYVYKNQKFEKTLEIDDAQTFGFVSSKSALPLLIVWTRLAPTEFGARVFHFSSGKYDEAGAWVERYDYADPHDDLDYSYIHEVPQIESRFSPGQSVPN